MSTQRETIEFILDTLQDTKRFSARAMFGEYALYADGKVVALVCDDQLYVKILPSSKNLETICEKDTPYPGAKLYYVVEEAQLTHIEDLSKVLFAIAKEVPAPIKRKKEKHEIVIYRVTPTILVQCIAQ